MRAGTSWLSELLGTHPDCGMPPYKELHFFDVRYGKYSGAEYYRAKANGLAQFGRSAARRIEAALDKMDTEEENATALESDTDELPPGVASKPWTDEISEQFFAEAQLEKSLARIAKVVDAFFMRDVASYVEYLRRYAAGATAFGEITPAYSLLPAAAFAEMDAAFPSARFIFIMRDPVDRLWSQVRFRNDVRRGRKLRISVDPNDDFRRALQRWDAVGRSSYQHTIEELESVVSVDRIHYLFYESMTSPETGPAEVRRIEAALGLRPIEIDQNFFSKPVHAAPPATLDAENEATAIQRFAPVYAFVEERFGRQRGWRVPGAVT